MNNEVVDESSAEQSIAQTVTARAALGVATVLAALALVALVVQVFAPADDVSDQASHQKMVETLEAIRLSAEREHHYLGDGMIMRQEKMLAERGDLLAPPQKAMLLMDLGEQYARLGRYTQSIERFEDALAIADGKDARMAAMIRLRMGVTQMRRGETMNCCDTANADSCILPIQGGGVHTQQEGSRAAIERFTEVLNVVPPSIKIFDTAQWLLNIAYMTLGEYPEGVPSRWRIAPEAFEGEEDFPKFVNVAPKLGVDTSSLAGGAIVDDFDGDDDLDIMTSSWNPSTPLQLYRNEGDGRFTDVSEASGLSALLGGLNLIQADYDNDGDIDVYVMRGAWEGDRGRQPNSLLRNDGRGRFTDVTYSLGLAEENYPSQTAAWWDYDRDGDLDLYVGNESTPDVDAPSQLFRNDGPAGFVDVAREAGVTNDRLAKAVTWGDYDGDGWSDIFVSNYEGENRLYRNLGNGRFEDVTATVGVDKPIDSFPAWFWEMNNDGRDDLFVPSYAGQVWNVAAHFAGAKPQFESHGMYVNGGDGQFENVAQRYGMTYPAYPMGSNYGDLDGDGWLDFYLGTGDPDFMSLMPSVMFVNRGGDRFVNVTLSGGFGHLQKGHGVAFADLDNDGDMDVFEQMGGAYLGDHARDALYANPGFGNNWLTVHLVGVDSNRSAIGAKIRIAVTDADGAARTIYRTVNSGGTFGANPLRQTIGLGQAQRIDSVQVTWPATARTQTFKGVALDQAIRITEGRDAIEPIALKRFTLGELPE